MTAARWRCAALCALLAAAYVAAFVPANRTGSANVNMLGVFQVDEFAQGRESIARVLPRARPRGDRGAARGRAAADPAHAARLRPARPALRRAPALGRDRARGSGRGDLILVTREDLERWGDPIFSTRTNDVPRAQRMYAFYSVAARDEIPGYQRLFETDFALVYGRTAH